MALILVCGGRDYENWLAIKQALDAFHSQTLRISLLIEGGARGADLLAEKWAHERGIHTARVMALWGYYDQGAGPVRNRVMATLKPRYCIAFPGRNGTADMIKVCGENDIPVWRPYGD